MKVVYVAGKYRGNSTWDTYQNIEKAKIVARRLWYEGWAVICPHANTAMFSGAVFSGRDDNERMWLDGDLELLRRCDAIYMMKGWQDSVGARGEHQLAIDLCLEVYYEEKDTCSV